MKICLFRLSALGDVVMMIPAVESILHAYPNAEITWVIGKAFYPIVEGLPGVKFVIIDKPKSIRQFFSAKRTLSQLGPFDYLLAMQASMSAHLLYPFIKADVKIGYDPSRSKDLHHLFINRSISQKNEHILEGFLSFVKELGISQHSYSGKIPIAKEIQERVKELMDRQDFYVLHPVASKLERTWSTSRYVELIDKIWNLYQIPCLITGGKQDQIFCKQIAEKCRSQASVSICGPVDLKVLAAILERAKFVIAPDTGPAHIASAMKTPTIGLYASMSSKITGPYFHRDLTVDCYEKALLHYNLPRTTKKGAYTRLHHADMMNFIEVSSVIKRVASVMQTMEQLTVP